MFWFEVVFLSKTTVTVALEACWTRIWAVDMRWSPVNNDIHADLLCTILTIFIINFRSLRYSLVIGIDCLLFARTWRSRSLLKKWWTKEIAITRCPRHPIMLLTSLAVVVHCWMIILIRFVQAMNLFFGSWTRRHRVSRSHPKMVFCSSNPASAWSLFLASIYEQPKEWELIPEYWLNICV